MGGDGGQVIDRATMVKCKGIGLTKESGGRYNNSLGEMNSYLQIVPEDVGLGPVERRRVRMSQCFLSQQPLRDPIVACRLGNLYNKEAVINALLSKTMPSGLSHIKALKDVKQCQLTWAEGCDAALTLMTRVQEQGHRRMVCPMTKDDLDAGGARAILIWPSGAVVSAKFLKEMKANECPLSGKAFSPDSDTIQLAPNEDEFNKLFARLPAKKKRKADALDAVGTGLGASASEAAQDAQTTAKPGKKTAPSEDQPKKKPDVDAAKGVVYNSLFTSDREMGRDGVSNAKGRDAFGCPMYNRGALIN